MDSIGLRFGLSLFLGSFGQLVPAQQAETFDSEASIHDDWAVHVAADFGEDTKLGGCAIGDFDPRHEGAEIAVVTGDGRVVVVRSTAAGFTHEVVAQLPGEAIQCAIGDCRADLLGDELVVVGTATGTEDDGGPGAYHVFSFDAGKANWQIVEHDERPALIHAVAIGDVLEAPGQELVLGGFYGHIDVGVFTEAGRAFVGRGAALSGNAKGVRVGLGGAVFACDDGRLWLATAREGAFHLEEYGAWEGGLARLAVDDHGVLVCDNRGELSYRQQRMNGGFGSTARVVRARDRLRGAVIADVDPTKPGAEFATAGYDGRIRVAHVFDVEPDEVGLRRVATDPPVRTIASSDFPVALARGRLHDLAAGTLPHRGSVLVAVGYAGRVLVVEHAGKR